MDGLLVSYANAAADVAGHVAFGVDPPALADFFSAVVFRVRFESYSYRTEPLLLRSEKGGTFGTRLLAPSPHTPPYVVGQVQNRTGRPSLTDRVAWDAVS
ncbi:hypothetical protein MHYP_G00030420 [Metynnis hypsauchen]